MRLNLKILTGIAITLLYLSIHLLIMNDYGISWDFHYHNFAGLYHLGQPVPKVTDPYPIPFTPPDPRLTTEDPFGPFTQIIPTVSYLIFFEKLHWLPFDSAYNLPSIVFGSLGILVLFLFINEAINFPTAMFSAVFLALLPTHFGYLHNNMKDVPDAFAFALAIYLFWRLTRYQRLRDLFWAVLAFAFAFNVKINSVMIPVVCLVWFMFKERKKICSILIPSPRKSTSAHPRGSFKALLSRRYRLIILFFILSPIAALLVWWPFWKDPLGKLLELPYFYSHNTLNMPVLLFGKIYRSGVNIPWIYPWIYILITTPLAILISFLVGSAVVLFRLFKKNDIYALLLLWLLIPLARYFTPKVSAIDGMRHFMEIIYPLSAIAGIGFYSVFRYLEKRKQKKIGLLIFTVVIITLLYNLVKFYPYQISFYNAIIGGVKGAEGKFDIDFWGVPQKEAMLWLDKNAPLNSYVNVIMAQSSAAMYGRNDLQERMNKRDIEKSDYTLILNKQSFFTIYPVEKYLDNAVRSKKVAYTKTIDGVPLFWIIRN